MCTRLEPERGEALQVRVPGDSCENHWEVVAGSAEVRWDEGGTERTEDYVVFFVWKRE
jgi:hypothetical protein